MRIRKYERTFHVAQLKTRFSERRRRRYRLLTLVAV